MKMAKASEADLEMAMELASALEALSSRWGATMPEKIAKPQRIGVQRLRDWLDRCKEQR